MMEYGATKIDERGYVKIPENLKGVFEPGKKIFAVREGDTIVLRESKLLEKESLKKEEKSFYYRDCFEPTGEF